MSEENLDPRKQTSEYIRIINEILDVEDPYEFYERLRALNEIVRTPASEIDPQ